jgi:hypothetical protein
LHQQIAIPVVRHCQGECSAKLFAANSSSTIHDSFNPAITRERRGPTLAPGLFFGTTGWNLGSSCNFDIWGFQFA